MVGWVSNDDDEDDDCASTPLEILGTSVCDEDEDVCPYEPLRPNTSSCFHTTPLHMYVMPSLMHAHRARRPDHTDDRLKHGEVDDDEGEEEDEEEMTVDGNTEDDDDGDMKYALVVCTCIMTHPTPTQLMVTCAFIHSSIPHARG